MRVTLLNGVIRFDGRTRVLTTNVLLDVLSCHFNRKRAFHPSPETGSFK